MGIIIPMERIRKRMEKKEYIEREAVIEFGERQLKRLDDGEAYRRLDAWLNSTPAADVRPVVRGEWGYRWKIHGDGRRPTELFPCSECGYENTSATNFCPNCGADMREES